MEAELAAAEAAAASEARSSYYDMEGLRIPLILTNHSANHDPFHT